MDGTVTFADRFLQGINIFNLNPSPRMIYHASSLESSRVQRNARSPYSKHLGKKLLGKLQAIAISQISYAKRPAA